MAFSADQYTAVLPDRSQLVLRPPVLADFEALVPVPESVTQYLGNYPLGKTAERIIQGFSGSYPRQTCWGIEAYGRMVGVTGLADPGYAETYPSGFVFVMDPEAWGMGIGPCARTVTAYHAFNQHHAPNAIGGYVHKSNIRSARMLGGIGFQGADHPRKRKGVWKYYLLANPNLETPANDTEERLLQNQSAREKLLARLASYSIQRV